ncbi:hypothetical protein D3C80_1763830 [compost metagenome]
MHQLHGPHTGQNPPGLLHTGIRLQTLQQSPAQSAFTLPADRLGAGRRQGADILLSAEQGSGRIMEGNRRSGGGGISGILK